MGAFFTAFGGLISNAVSYIVHFFSNTVMAFRAIGITVSFASDMISNLPVILGIFASALISIKVAYLIIGR